MGLGRKIKGFLRLANDNSEKRYKDFKNKGHETHRELQSRAKARKKRKKKSA